MCLSLSLEKPQGLVSDTTLSKTDEPTGKVLCVNVYATEQNQKEKNSPQKVETPARRKPNGGGSETEERQFFSRSNSLTSVLPPPHSAGNKKRISANEEDLPATVLLH